LRAAYSNCTSAYGGKAQVSHEYLSGRLLQYLLKSKRERVNPVARLYCAEQALKLLSLPSSSTFTSSFYYVMAPDLRFVVDDQFLEEDEARNVSLASGSDSEDEVDREDEETTLSDAQEDEYALSEGMDAEGFAGPSKVVKPLTPEALRAFKAAQEKAGVVYISRIPPGMRPTKVRHLMSQHGEIGRVYLQQESASHLFSFVRLGGMVLTRGERIDAKRAYLRRKHTSTKKAHFTEGWVEFKDKKVARAVAEMLNAQPIGGKKGTRWRDDVWTMKYLPRFKWDMLTEQIGEIST
jgi:ESF2/ABP1 family protein